MTTPAEQKRFSEPDETRSFERGRVDLVNIGGSQIGQLTLEPGWSWSAHVKPLAGTDLCEAPHFQYQLSGALGWRMATDPRWKPTPAMWWQCHKDMTPG